MIQQVCHWVCLCMDIPWFLRGVAVVCLLCSTAPAGAEEEQPPASEGGGVAISDEELLNRLLEEAANDTRAFRSVAGGFGVASGVSLFTLGVVRLVQDPGDNRVLRGLGLMWLGTGAASLTTGLILLTRRSPEERMLRRWKARRAGAVRLSEYELGSYAGELRAAAAFRKRERNLVRWSALAGAGAGGLALALIPAANDLTDSSRRNVIIVGSVFLGIGLMNFGLSFRTSGTEEAWEEYQGSTLSSRRGVKMSFAPTVLERGGGMGLVGLF